MKIIFLNLSTLSSNAGHLARFNLEIGLMQKQHEVHVVCLGKLPDDEKTRLKYHKVKFVHNPISFNGWEVKSLELVTEGIEEYARKNKADLVVLQVEIWDLMRGLSSRFKNKIPFATVVHAMPFLGSPIKPSGDFELDVLEYAYSDISEYRKDYILKYYKEANEVFKDIYIIANNKTVSYYLNLYFKNLKLRTMEQFLISPLREDVLNVEAEYDFVYMARMEKGKGLEYLSDILIKASQILQKQVNIIIMGKLDDQWSKDKLAEIEAISQTKKKFKVMYMGWADNKTKEDIFPKCKVFIYPSVYDNYPTVVCEALSFGLPAVVWKVPFYQHNFSNIEAVKGVELFDLKLFAELAISTLKNHEELSRSAKKIMKNLSNNSQMTIGDLEIFKEIINEK